MATPSSFSRTIVLCLALSGVALMPAPASAANILFVTDNGSESVLTGILESDGHDVTIRNRDFTFGMNTSFSEDLGEYDCIVWIANGDGYGGYPHTDLEAFMNLNDYVENGGRVFVTGYGSVMISDTNLIQFLGGTGGTGYSGYPAAIADLDTSLTNGPYDIRGATPTGYDYQYDYRTDAGRVVVDAYRQSFVDEGRLFAKVQEIGERLLARTGVRFAPAWPVV